MAWEPWTGCYKISDGCTYCYYYGLYSKYYGCNRLQKQVFLINLQKRYICHAKGGKIQNGGREICNTCFTTDFFIPEADEWRAEAWSIIKRRPDLIFLF